MKLSSIIASVFLIFLIPIAKAQSLVGSWQLVKQTTCLDEGLKKDTPQKDIKNPGDQIPQIIRFIDQQNIEESTRILNTRKNVSTKHFLYKLDSATLYILDKRTRTIAETYNIDSWQGDNLILSHAARPCETKVFIKLK
jgi:hypothetical protein